jgi:hypothetical protein
MARPTRVAVAMVGWILALLVTVSSARAAVGDPHPDVARQPAHDVSGPDQPRETESIGRERVATKDFDLVAAIRAEARRSARDRSAEETAVRRVLSEKASCRIRWTIVGAASGAALTVASLKAQGGGGGGFGPLIVITGALVGGGVGFLGGLSEC